MHKIDVTPEVIETIRDAADEIESLSGADNDVCRRLRNLLRHISPRAVTVGQLASQIDVAPHDVLDAAVGIGIKPFWHDGQLFREPAYLRTYLRLESPYDPVREIEFELLPETARRLAEELVVTPEEMLPDSETASGEYSLPPRKFVASETRWPAPTSAHVRRDQTG